MRQSYRVGVDWVNCLNWDFWEWEDFWDFARLRVCARARLFFFRFWACLFGHLWVAGFSAPPPAPFFWGAGLSSPFGVTWRLGRGAVDCPCPELGGRYRLPGSFPLLRLFGLKRSTPERGQMLRRAVCETASNRCQSRHASPDRVLGRRLDDWGRRSEYAAFLRFALAGSSRAVASLL